MGAWEVRFEEYTHMANNPNMCYRGSFATQDTFLAKSDLDLQSIIHYLILRIQA